MSQPLPTLALLQVHGYSAPRGPHIGSRQPWGSLSPPKSSWSVALGPVSSPLVDSRVEEVHLVKIIQRGWL